MSCCSKLEHQNWLSRMGNWKHLMDGAASSNLEYQKNDYSPTLDNRRKKGKILKGEKRKKYNWIHQDFYYKKNKKRLFEIWKGFLYFVLGSQTNFMISHLITQSKKQILKNPWGSKQHFVKEIQLTKTKIHEEREKARNMDQRRTTISDLIWFKEEINSSKKK